MSLEAFVLEARTGNPYALERLRSAVDVDFLERAVQDALMVRELLVERNRLIGR